MTLRSISDPARENRRAAGVVLEAAAPLAVVSAVLAGADQALSEVAWPVLLPLVAALGSALWTGLRWVRARRRLAQSLADREELSETLERTTADLAAARADLARREESRATLRGELERANAAARRAEAARARFLATMSHELRTPLNGVLGMAGLLASEPLPGEAGDWAASALESARDLARQLDGIFDWIAIEDEALVVERRAFSLAEVRDHLEGDLAARVEARGLAFAARFHAGLPKRVRGDRRRLLQILEHLVDNACKFTSAGDVSVEVRRGDSDEVIFEVRDTGTGFDERALEGLFEPFTVPDASTTRRYDGAGLGLALAQRIAALMGGRIDVENDVGSGACVRLVVRLEPVTESRGTTVEVPIASRRILVVDDNPVNRRLVAAVVSRAGHEPLLARDGLEAVEIFRTERPDLVLMDCFMPGLDGLGATRRIRELELRRGGGHVPIVALTAGLQDIEVFPEERFSFPPFPAAHTHTMRDPLAAKKVTGSDGKDWTKELEKNDKRFAQPFVTHGDQFRGLAEPYFLELEFDAERVREASKLRLALNGWLVWTDASVNVASARHPEKAFIPPILQIPDGAGGWKDAGPPLGFPAGKLKTMVIDVSDMLDRSDPRIRIFSTLVLYWDSMRLATDADDAPFVVTSLEADSADLWERGFSAPQPFAVDGVPLVDLEWFEWEQVARTPRWNMHPGFYTRFGDVLELLGEIDDRFCILGAGDALTVRFDAELAPPLKPGWKRSFLVFFDGWAKDRDHNTEEALYVRPYPFHGMSGYPYGPDESFPDTEAHLAWEREWNTRPAKRWIDPLVPARIPGNRNTTRPIEASAR